MFGFPSERITLYIKRDVNQGGRNKSENMVPRKLMATRREEVNPRAKVDMMEAKVSYTGTESEDIKC
jgi:hypothetical protein